MTTRPDDIERVIALFRVSTEAQEREGYSLPAQQTAFDRDARTFGWRCVETFQGQESGSSLADRHIIHELIAAVRATRPDAIWCIEQSRLTRGDELDVALLLRELQENGTKVVVERGTIIDPSDVEGAFVFRLKGLLDRREWEVIKIRNQRGKDEKAKQGLLASGKPAYGYTVAGEGKTRGQRVPVPEEAAVVRQIFEWAAQGMSLREIIKSLFERGIPGPTQSGRNSGMQPKRFKKNLQLWGRTTLSRMLMNPIYIGVSYRNCWVKKGSSFVFDKDNPKAIWVENAHETIIPAELWEAVQRQRIRKRKPAHATPYMLTGLLVCPHCGSTYGTEMSRDGANWVRRYYVCRSKVGQFDEFGKRTRTAANCASRWLPLKKLDQLVWDAFVELVTSPSMIETYLASAPATQKREMLKTDRDRMSKQAVAIERKLARAREKLLSEVLTDGEYLTERERFTAELSGIQRSIREKEQMLESLTGDLPMQVIRNLSMLKLGEKKLSDMQRRKLFRQFVQGVRLNGAQPNQIEFDLLVRNEETFTKRVGTTSNAGQSIAVPVQLSVALPQT